METAGKNMEDEELRELIIALLGILEERLFAILAGVASPDFQESARGRGRRRRVACDQPVLDAALRLRLTGFVQASLDLAQHGDDLWRVWFHHQHRFAFLHRERIGADPKISLRQATRNPERLLGFAEFLVGDLEDFERLIIVRLRLSNDLKHLNRLENLAPLLFG